MLEELYNGKKKQLLLGFLIGIGFGFLLDKGGATDFDIIVNQLLLKDFRVLKIIFTAIITGMIGVHLIVRYFSPKLQPKPCQLKPIIIGGLIFGAGFAILGLCPGTAAGAMGTGAVHAIFGVIGMLVGAGIFASVYPHISDFMSDSDKGPVTIPDLLGVSAWWVILAFSIILAAVMYLLETFGF
ncbi:MAG: YeeE/YedE thiosulfate transporter family protein [Candidatus Thermoplasmatota archaeon]